MAFGYTDVSSFWFPASADGGRAGIHLAASGSLTVNWRDRSRLRAAGGQVSSFANMVPWHHDGTSQIRKRGFLTP